MEYVKLYTTQINTKATLEEHMEDIAVAVNGLYKFDRFERNKKAYMLWDWVEAITLHYHNNATISEIDRLVNIRRAILTIINAGVFNNEQ